MKFYFSLIAFIFVSLFISSGFSTSSSLQPGDPAPAFTVTTDSTTFTLSQANHGPVLITFWSVSDAMSRRQCQIYSSATRGTGINHVAINLDQNSTLYKEILRTSPLPGSDCYSPSAQQIAQIAHFYYLEGNFGSVLVSAQGKILAFNPDPAEISRKR